MNIAFIHTIFPGGGAERISRDIAAELSGDGRHRFFVFAQRLVPEALTDSYRSCFAAIDTYPIGEEETEVLETLVRKYEIDAIILISRRIHDIDGFRRRTGCKIIFANHGEAFHLRYEVVLGKCRNRFRTFQWKLYRRWIYEDLGYAMHLAKKSCLKDYLSCDRYVVLCEDYRKRICDGLHLDIVSSHICVIENSEKQVDDVCYDKENLVLFSGRLEQFSKRVDRLLRIWQKVAPNIPQWRLVIAGEGPDGEMLRRMAAEMGLERVEFLGYCSDMSGLYRRASVLCLTSQTEGWPLSLAEAQANGVIPIAFAATGGIRDILEPDGVNGFLVTPFDEDEYARKLLALVNMPEEEKLRIRHAVVKKAESYSPARTAEKWKKLFDNLEI